MEITSPEGFSSKDKGLGIHGRIPPEYGQMIHGLMDESSLELEVSCSFNETDASLKPDKVYIQRLCSLAITVYGPFELFDEIGSWFQDYNIYLQDPVIESIHTSSQDAKYCNPHRLSVQDLVSCSLVSELALQNSKLAGFEELVDRPDFLDILSTHADLPETQQPTAVRTNLKR